MNKLWNKGYQLDSLIETFTVGDDPIWDKKLTLYDCLGSMAHSAMLYKTGILTSEELKLLHAGLNEIINDDNFQIHLSEEDVHTAVENKLTTLLGNVGKKLHTARSRNDQIAVDLRLYIKDHLFNIGERVLLLAKTLISFAQKYSTIPIPGRTHMQRAMPSSLGLWAGAFAESFLDDFTILQNSYDINDQCPLGSAASYGTSLPIDREYTAKLLGFSKVQNNVLYANNSRGKFESIVVHGLSQVMSDLSKLASDIIFFSIPEVAYIILPEELCPGSSLMPQKRNPCPLELMRAKAATVQGHLSTLLDIIRPLTSGYHRDFQETKIPLMKSMEITISATATLDKIFQNLGVDEEKCIGSFSRELFATDHLLELVKKGIPFRDAYKQVAAKVSNLSMPDPQDAITSRTHQGTTGNLGLELAQQQISNHEDWLTEQKYHWQQWTTKLISGEYHV